MPIKTEFKEYLKEAGEKLKQIRIQTSQGIPAVASGSGLTSLEIENIEKGNSAQYELKKFYDLCSYYKVDARIVLGT